MRLIRQYRNSFNIELLLFTRERYFCTKMYTRDEQFLNEY